MAYRPRIIDGELDVLMTELAAIALDGPKGVGKTATAARRARTVFALDDPGVAEVVSADLRRVSGAPGPVLVDEWQAVPATWDAVRRSVDDGAPPGSFLLTGSATPSAGATTHSGAGRIVSLRMRPLSLAERGGHLPTVSLAHLLNGAAGHLDGESELTLTDYAEEIEASGFPGLRGLTSRARRAQLDAYLLRSMSKDLTDELGVTLRRPASLRAWLTAYAAATSTTASWETVRRAASPGDGDPPTKVTTIRYRDWLTSLWLLDPVPAWTGAAGGISRLAAGPKHHLADPALAARLLRASAESMLSGAGHPAQTGHSSLLGGLFESLAAQSVRVYAQAAEAATFHVRTHQGEREVDLVVERHDGALLGIEVKLSSRVDDHDVRHLHWLRETLGHRVRDLVVLTTGTTAYRRRDGVAVVPLALLGP